MYNSNLKNREFKIIIQARFNSTRLKGKILKKINNKEILLIMLERLKKFKQKIIINISNKNSSKIIKFCKDNNVNYFVGSDKNVLKRYYDCAVFYKCKNIVRIPSDCPIVDVGIVERALKIYFNNNYSYVTNLQPPTFIDGNDVEVMSFNTLKKLYLITKDNFDKEHVTTNLRRNLANYKYKNFTTRENCSLRFRYTLDYNEDFEVIKKIILKFGIHPSYSKILSFLKKNKKISNINKKHIGTMWYQRKY
jgi:spore coat polysaccharide biosynthesis protein SpsF